MTTVIEFPSKRKALWDIFETALNRYNYFDEEIKNCARQKIKPLLEKYGEDAPWGSFRFELRDIPLPPELKEDCEQQIIKEVKERLGKYIQKVLRTALLDIVMLQLEMCSLEQELSKRSDRN